MTKLSNTLTVATSLTCITFAGVSLTIGANEFFAANGWETITAVTFATLFFAIHIAYESDSNIYGFYDFAREVRDPEEE